MKYLSFVFYTVYTKLIYFEKIVCIMTHFSVHHLKLCPSSVVAILQIRTSFIAHSLLFLHTSREQSGIMRKWNISFMFYVQEWVCASMLMLFWGDDEIKHLLLKLILLKPWVLKAYYKSWLLFGLLFKCLFLFIYGFFNYAISRSDYVVLNEELAHAWKEVVMIEFTILSWHLFWWDEENHIILQAR
jgi:hypothetical protein